LLDKLVRRDADADESLEVLWLCWYSSLLDEYRLRVSYLANFSDREAVAEDFSEWRGRRPKAGVSQAAISLRYASSTRRAPLGRGRWAMARNARSRAAPIA
jgi:hypothetical protein